MPIYGGLDQASLDAQYDNQRHVPGYRDVLAEYTRRSAEARATLRRHLGVPYGPGERQKLDIFPAANPCAPVHVFFHGGAWRALHRDDAAAQAPAYVAAGITYVAAGFDLATEVTLEAMVFQARQATAWVAAHATGFGADPTRLTVSGHSSGAHLAACVAVTDWPGLFGLPADTVKGAALVSGLYDLEPVRLSARNTLLQLTPERATALSPIAMRSLAGLRLVLGMAEQETGEFHRQTRALRDAWHGPEPIMATSRNHYDVALDLADADSLIGTACLQLASG